MSKILMTLLTAVILLGAVAGTLVACVARTPSGEAVDAQGNKRAEDEIVPVGEAAPAFDLVDQTGNAVRLADFKGKKNVVLVFYPGDDTPGCTKQLCAIRDDWSQFDGKDVAVYGVNPADAGSHKKFVEKFSFPFPLLVDSDGKLIRDYGCRGAMGITTRTVYGIDKTGKVVFAERGMPDNAKILAAFGG